VPVEVVEKTKAQEIYKNKKRKETQQLSANRKGKIHTVAHGIKKAKRAQKSVTPYFLMALGLFIKTIIELQSPQTPLVNELQ
tara:strand:+ start:254 stop:499 length:246 start_codon:yes stop_codon:yes gene_type:complete